MTRYLIVLAAAATATVSMISADAQPTRAKPDEVQPRVISQTRDGRPIQLGTMTVTATALPDTE